MVISEDFIGFLELVVQVQGTTSVIRWVASLAVTTGNLRVFCFFELAAHAFVGLSTFNAYRFPVAALATMIKLLAVVALGYGFV